MHKLVHVFHIRVGIILEINTCGKQGRALETAADNSRSSCLMLAYASRIHYHLFFQREALHQQAAAHFGLCLSKRLKHWGLSEEPLLWSGSLLKQYAFISQKKEAESIS